MQTYDGHELLPNHHYFRIWFEDDSSYIESLRECIYEGSFTRNNKPYLDSLPIGCSGMPIPEFEEIHCFVDFVEPNTQFELSESDIGNIIIQDSESVKKVTKLKLKGKSDEDNCS